MKVSTFIKKKNKIIFEETGLILVPEDQIEECAKYKLYIDTPLTYACPYCADYTDYTPQDGECEKCPMYIAGNGCNDVKDSSWRLLVEWVYSHTGSSDVEKWYATLPEMVKLYKKYNKQFDKEKKCSLKK